MSSDDAILQEFVQEAETTRRILESVPEERLSWRPHAKSRTIGQLALHLATIPMDVDAMMKATTFEAVASSPSPRDRSDILRAFDGSVAALKETLARLPAAERESTVTLTAGGRSLLAMPRNVILRTILLNHSYHHRGQLTVYLRLLDEPVPITYGPTADVNPFGQ